MAIDQRDVSSTLRFMDDRALQQYAAMHKSDPYIFPLAFQESQNRQKLRMSQQAQAGAQPQPKVADQALAQMAPPQAQPMPETQGIGALPAPNMRFAAEGGILGYDDANFAERSEPVLRMAEGGHVPRYQGNQRDGSLVSSGAMYDPATGVIIADPAAYGGTDDRTLLERLGIFNPENRRALEKAEREQAAREEAKTPGAKAAKAAEAQVAPPVAPPVTTTTAAPGAAPRADTGQAAPRAPAVPEQTAAQRYAEMQKAMGTGSEASADVEWKRSQLADRMRAQSKSELEDFDKEVAARGEAFKGREERLSKREAGLAKQKDENTGLSLLEAGLAIMSTPGSLATAIGKGAQAGLKTYGAGLKDLRAAQEKMDDARDQIEEFRRNEANMTAKERRQFKSAINKTETDIEKLGLDAAEKMYGYKREDTKAIFTADTQERISDKDNRSRENIAGKQLAATLNTPDRLVFNQLLKDNGNDAVKAAEAMQKMKAEKFNVYDSYSKYLAGFAGKDPAMVGAPESITKYASRFPALTPPAPVDTSKPTRP